MPAGQLQCNENGIPATNNAGAATEKWTDSSRLDWHCGGAFRWTALYAYNTHVMEVRRQTVIRRSDEPKLEVGDTAYLKEGVFGVVVARFTPSNERPNEVHYIVESNG